MLGAALASAAVLTGCAATTKTPGSASSPSPSSSAAAAHADPATTARAAEFSHIKTQMTQAMQAAGLTASAIENIHPSGTLTGAPDCLASYLIQIPLAKTPAVTAALTQAMTHAGWTADPSAAAGTVALDHGDWTLTVSHQTSGTDVDPATGKVRTGPLTFFQAKNNTFDCN
jgi:hypothetical protein